MIVRRALIVVLFFCNININAGWDGCDGFAWKCGNECIHTGDDNDNWEILCKCGGEMFNLTAQMWCCNDKPCVGR